MATVLITGANRGIGLALAKTYRQAGDTVIATAREPKEADELNALGVDVRALDVCDGDSVQRFAKALDGRAVDLLIHNAGVGDRAGLGAIDYDAFARILEVNTIAPVRIVEALADNVAASQGKTIAVVSSQLGSIENTNGDMGLIYRVSKAGANMAMRAAAPKLAERGITCIVLHPGWVRTDMGGPNAAISPQESAAGMKAVLDRAGPSDSLRFMDWKGAALPW